MIFNFNYNTITDMRTTFMKASRAAAGAKQAPEKSISVDYSQSSIVQKTLRMTETLKKFPRPEKR